MEGEGSSRHYHRGGAWGGRRGGGRGGPHRGRPPGLRGRDIGLYYAKRSREKKEESRSVVTLDSNQKRSIRKLFSNFQSQDLRPKEASNFGGQQSFISDYRRHLAANASVKIGLLVEIYHLGHLSLFLYQLSVFF